MHTIKLQVQDSIYSHIMFFLNNLKTKELQIIEDERVDIAQQFNETQETKAFSNHTANAIEEWKELSEDDIWK